MTKQEICNKHPTIAYLDNFGRIEIKHIAYGIEDFIYLTVGSCRGNSSCHKLKIYYDNKHPYIKLYGIRYRLSNFLRV